MRGALLAAGVVDEQVLAPYDTRIAHLGRWVVAPPHPPPPPVG